MKKAKTVLIEHFFIWLGSFILAISINMFLAPHQTSGGGVGTISTILYHLEEIPMSVTTLICNAVLFVLGYKFLGKYAVVKTISGILSLSLFLELTYIEKIITQCTKDIIVATIIGGILMGIGVGLAVRFGASTGGSDFAALMIKRFFPHISVATIILVIDTIIIAISGIVFEKFEITVYSAVALYISSVVTNAIVTIGDAAKGIQVLSSKYNEIANKIMEELGRGVTGIKCTGMYTQNEGQMLYCVVSPKELPIIVKLVKSVDSSAFIIITDAREVLGEGFKTKTIYDETSN